MGLVYLMQGAFLEIEVLEQQCGEQADEDPDQRGPDEDQRKVQERKDRRTRGVRVANELGERREEHDRHCIVQHALAEHEVEQRRVHMELLEDRKRGHGILHTWIQKIPRFKTLSIPGSSFLRIVAWGHEGSEQQLLSTLSLLTVALMSAPNVRHSAIERRTLSPSRPTTKSNTPTTRFEMSVPSTAKDKMPRRFSKKKRRFIVYPLGSAVDALDFACAHFS